MKKIVFFLLLTAGVGLLFSPFLESAVVEATKDRYLLSNYTIGQITDNIEKAKVTEHVIEDDIAVPDVTDILKYASDIESDYVLGAVGIASVGLYQPIFYGTTKASLIAGAGTMKEDQIMGRGNYCLAGHHMRDQSLLFGPLSKVQPGDWIQLTDKRSVYTYEVTQIEVIHQTEIEVLEDIGTPAVTLITCEEGGFNTNYRLMVRGSLINISQMEVGSKNNQYLDVFGYLDVNRKRIGSGWLWLWIVIVLMVTTILFWGGLVILKRSESRRQIDDIKDGISGGIKDDIENTGKEL